MFIELRRPSLTHSIVQGLKQVWPRLPAVSEKKAPEERHVYRINASFPAPFFCSRMKAGVAAFSGSQRKKSSRGAPCL
jgi:hypothetical protein